jgi:hypothetical protein
MFSSSPISKLVPAVTLSLVLGLPAVVSADTITVCWDGSGDYLTIQEGIDAAVDGDEVVVCDGVYTGQGNKNLDFGGKAITVRSENGPDNCVIDCEGDGRGFHFHSGETTDAVLDGFTITNGDASDYGWGGGAVLCEDLSSPTISDCAVIGNTADGGGGIYCEDSSPVISNCTITGNAAGSGGGICCAVWYEQSSPLISDCTISGNSANGGGGVYCDEGSPTIADCTITGNTVQGSHPGGGGIFCDSSSATISNCTISENTTAGEHGEGAGVYCWLGDPTITNCVITANRAEEQPSLGGGVYCHASDPTISNCIIAGNVAVGVTCLQASPTLINNLVTGNSSVGVSCQSQSDALLINCTFTLNGTAGIGCAPLSNPTITNCIVWWDAISVHASEPVLSYSDVQGGWPGEGNIDADPLFVDPDGPDDDPNTWADNDYHLASGSPCIDAGCNWGVPRDSADLDDDGDTDEITPLDLDGEGRFFDDPGTEDTGGGCPPIVDMGAYEFGDAGPQPCPGDLDCDRVVGHSDLAILLSAWQNSDEGDLNCDGVTGHADLGILLSNWGNVCP